MSLSNTIAIHAVDMAARRADVSGRAAPQPAATPTQQSTPTTIIPDPPPKAPPGLNEKIDILVSWGNTAS